MSIEDVLEEKIRRVVREELRAAPVQEIGAIDEFDLAESIRKHDNPAIVLKEWYRHDGLPIDDISVPVFKDWDAFTIEEKAEELRAFRRLEKKRKELRRNVLSPKAT